MPGRLPDPGPRAKAAMAAAARGDELPTNDVAPSTTSDAGERRPSGAYEQWTVEELQHRAAELGIQGRSTMRKDELVAALRKR